MPDVPDLRTAAQALSDRVVSESKIKGRCVVCGMISARAAHFEGCAVPALRAALAAEATEPPSDGAVIDAAHLTHQREWSRETFGPGARTGGVIDHIRKELGEIEDDPSDLGEWVDVIILSFDGAWRAGWEPQQIIDAVKAKQARNEARTWPDWRSMSEDHAIEHDRSSDIAGSAPNPQGDPELIAELEVLAQVMAEPDEPGDDRRPCDGPTDYTNPATIDVDVVIGEINQAHRMRGHTWTDRLSWPNVTVAALAAEVERLRGSEAALRRAFDVAQQAGFELWAEVERLRAAAPASEDDPVRIAETLNKRLHRVEHEWRALGKIAEGLLNVIDEALPPDSGVPLSWTREHLLTDMVALRAGAERAASGSPPPTPAPTREPLADAPGRLRTLADWLDMAPRFGDMQGDEVQQDLRRYAEYIEALLSTPPAPTDPRPALYDALTRIVGDIGPIADESSRRTAAHMLRHYGAQAQPT